MSRWCSTISHADVCNAIPRTIVSNDSRPVDREPTSVRLCEAFVPAVPFTWHLAKLFSHWILSRSRGLFATQFLLAINTADVLENIYPLFRWICLVPTIHCNAVSLSSASKSVYACTIEPWSY